MTKFLQMWKEETEELVLAWKGGRATQAATTALKTDEGPEPRNAGRL